MDSAALGKKAVYQGAAGMGQHTKLANQIAIAGTLAACCEAMAYAPSAGLDPDTVLESISEGSAASWQMSNMIPMALKGDLSPTFYAKHFIKDMRLAYYGSLENDITLPVLTRVLSMYEELYESGAGACGTQVLMRYYDENL